MPARTWGRFAPSRTMRLYQRHLPLERDPKQTPLSFDGKGLATAALQLQSIAIHQWKRWHLVSLSRHRRPCSRELPSPRGGYGRGVHRQIHPHGALSRRRMFPPTTHRLCSKRCCWPTPKASAPPTGSPRRRVRTLDSFGSVTCSPSTTAPSTVSVPSTSTPSPKRCSQSSYPSWPTWASSPLTAPRSRRMRTGSEEERLAAEGPSDVDSETIAEAARHINKRIREKGAGKCPKDDAGKALRRAERMLEGEPSARGPILCQWLPTWAQ